MTVEFSEFVREKTTQKSKVERMIDLLPEFELGIKNGHAVNEICRVLSESKGHFFEVNPDIIRSVYYYAKKKTDKATSKDRGAT